MNPAHRGRKQQGYVLVMVLAALVLIALVAGRFAARNDALRATTASFQDYAQGQIAAHSALQVGLYWLSTHANGPGGYGGYPRPQVFADGRPYDMFGQAELQVQDWRGTVSLNTAQRPLLGQLLKGLGTPPERIDAMLDTLLDYQDTDHLKRLNGAEAADYAALGMPPPRDDWLLAISELSRIPLWRDQPELIAKLQNLATVRRESILNPNTMPIALIAALMPHVNPEQLAHLETLRRTQPFDSAAAMLAATGVDLRGDDFLFYVGDRLRLTVWAPGLPQAYQYNLTLVPGGETSPWNIGDVQLVPRDNNAQNAPSARATPFPLTLAGTAGNP